MRLRRLVATSLALIAGLHFALPLGFAEGLPDLGESAQADLPPTMEKRIGQTIYNEYKRDSDFVDDPEVDDYINRLGQKLVAQVEGDRPDFVFFVIRDKTLNAFAMPGGFIGVHTGLITAAQTESELAGVLAHEVSHVTQRHLARLYNKQNQYSVPTMIAMGLALLAARNSPDVAVGGALAASAVGVQSALNYTRDFEREADRLGFSLLARSGYDVRGMEAFFDRLQKFGRLYENNAPAYLRTHPLTTERISDMGNRVLDFPYRQVRDPIDFILIQAKLRAAEGQPRDTVAEFSKLLQEKRYANEAATQFGLAYALLRAREFAAAHAALQEARRLLKGPDGLTPMLDNAEARILLAEGKATAAEPLARSAMQRYPQSRALVYALIEALQAQGKHANALQQIKLSLQITPTDAKLYQLQAQSFAAQGKLLQQHRAQAEAYALNGQLMPAILQLQLAQKSPDGDFFEYSQVEARLRDLKEKQAEEAKDKKK